MGPGLRGGSRCSARNRLTTKHATDIVWLNSNLCLAKRTQSAEQLEMAQPWALLEEEEEEEEEGSSGGGDFSDED